MADSKLTDQQARTLLGKLAKDNAFRSAFAAKPAAALRDLGVDAETIVHLPAACICPRTLASAVLPVASVTTARRVWTPTSAPVGTTVHVQGALVAVQTLRLPRKYTTDFAPAGAVGVVENTVPRGASLSAGLLKAIASAGGEGCTAQPAGSTLIVTGADAV